MFRVLTPLMVLFAWGVLVQSARASGDFSCDPHWKLKQTVYTGCVSTVLLRPSNDTRVNLVLLLQDKRPDKAPAAGPAPDGAAPFSWPDFESVIYGKTPADPNDPNVLTAPGLSTFAEGEGTRCVSNAGGAADFDKALADAPRLPPDEKAALTQARDALKPGCDQTPNAQGSVADAVKAVKSSGGRPYADYLAAAADFYDGDFDLARVGFTRLKSASAPWLKEAAAYMLGRVEVNAAQVGIFGDYGEITAAKVDPKILAAADTALHAYLRDYPCGRYAASARGLLRRVYWLGGARDKLMAEYAWQFAQTDPAARNLTDADLAQEVDAKFLDKPDPSDVVDLTLLAVIDLMKMRHEDAAGVATPLSLADLKAQASRFAAEPNLFAYLLAVHATFVDNDSAEVLRLIPAETPTAPLSTLAFSRLALRAMALEAVNDPGARAAWLQLYPFAKRPYQRPTIDLGLALYDERHGGLSRVFAPGSPVHDVQVREILLRHGAGPILLRQQVADAAAPRHERRVALFTLLYKDLTRGNYRNFGIDMSLMPADIPAKTDSYDPLGVDPELGRFNWTGATNEYACPAIRETAAQLSANPRLAKARLCVGEFARLNGFDHFELDASRPADELGGAPSIFPGPAFARQAIYQAVIADPAAPADDKAYALYRAVRCYAPSGNNDCGGADVPVAQRKAWFTTLKTQYGASRWADQLKLFW